VVADFMPTKIVRARGRDELSASAAEQTHPKGQPTVVATWRDRSGAIDPSRGRRPIRKE
jgi:hypothetical protein